MKKLPHIGIFWIYKSQIYLKSIQIDNIKPIDGFIDSDFAHYLVWDKISAQNSDFYLYEYEDIPRGRIVYDVKDRRYIVYSNEDIINSEEARNLIIEAFHLDNDRVLFQYDMHYKIEELI